MFKLDLQQVSRQGVTYKLSFSEPTDQDVLFSEQGVVICVPLKHIPIIQGTLIDWDRDQTFNRGWIYKNPNLIGAENG